MLKLEFLNTKEKDKMKITSLEKMESIVNNNKSLSWDGWTVVKSYQSDKGRTSKFGAYKNNKWYMQTRFTPTRDGWDIPDNLVG